MGRKKKSEPPPKFATSHDWHKHHICLFDDLLDSPAFLALSHHARSLYVHLYRKYTGPYSGNNIICTYSELEQKGFRRNTTAKALRMLYHFGFISYESGGLEHQPNIYHFEEGWKKIFTQEDVDKAMKAYKDEIALKCIFRTVRTICTDKLNQSHGKSEPPSRRLVQWSNNLNYGFFNR